MYVVTFDSLHVMFWELLTVITLHRFTLPSKYSTFLLLVILYFTVPLKCYK